MSDYKSRDKYSGAFKVASLIVVAIICFMVVKWVKADPIVVKAELVLYPDAMEVHRECQARNPDHKANSYIPSCFRGDATSCTIIARLPDDTEEDLAGAALLSRELNNCVRGKHKFAVNPE